MKTIRQPAASQQLVHSFNKINADKIACLFFVIGMILAAIIFQTMIFPH